MLPLGRMLDSQTIKSELFLKVIRITEKLIKNKTVPALSPLIFEINDMEFISQIFLAYRALAYSTKPRRS